MPRPGNLVAAWLRRERLYGNNRTELLADLNEQLGSTYNRRQLLRWEQGASTPPQEVQAYMVDVAIVDLVGEVLATATGESVSAATRTATSIPDEELEQLVAMLTPPRHKEKPP